MLRGFDKSERQVNTILNQIAMNIRFCSDTSLKIRLAPFDIFSGASDYSLMSHHVEVVFNTCLPSKNCLIHFPSNKLEYFVYDEVVNNFEIYEYE